MAGKQLEERKWCGERSKKGHRESGKNGRQQVKVERIGQMTLMLKTFIKPGQKY